MEDAHARCDSLNNDGGTVASFRLGRTMSQLQAVDVPSHPVLDHVGTGEHWAAEIEMAADERGFNPDLRLTGNRRALKGEKILLELDGVLEGVEDDSTARVVPCQITNYRLLLAQEQNFWQNSINIDTWLKDVATCEVRDAGYNAVLTWLGAIFVVGGAVNKRTMEGVSFDSSDVVYVSMAPIVFYIFGLIFFGVAYQARGIALVVGIAGQNSDQYFEVNIKEPDLPKVTKCIDLIRKFQMPAVMRRQRAFDPNSKPPLAQQPQRHRRTGSHNSNGSSNGNTTDPP